VVIVGLKNGREGGKRQGKKNHRFPLTKCGGNENQSISRKQKKRGGKDLAWEVGRGDTNDTKNVEEEIGRVNES